MEQVADTTELVLNEGQQQALDALLNTRRNVLIHGPAGTGKSVVTRTFRLERPHVVVTAPTGVAAQNVDGTTIHRWIGWRASYASPEDWYDKRNWRFVREQIRATRLLLIDEISMLGARQLEIFDAVCRHATQCKRPFGGIRVVAVGDMGQLPPVRDAYPFEAAVWKQLDFMLCPLAKVERQQEGGWVELLHRLRRGALTEQDFATLRDRVSAFDPRDTDPPAIRLVGTNRQVDSINEFELRLLEGKEETFQAHDEFYDRKGAVTDPKSWDEDLLDKEVRAPKEIVLKEGARVMVTKNIPQAFNGNLGTVVGWEDSAFVVYVRLDGEDDVIEVTPVTFERYELTTSKGRLRKRLVATRYQFPLRVAYAVTVHKSQGLTLDRASIDPTLNMQPGTAYVALSRTRSLDGINLEDPVNPDAVKVHPKVAAFLAEIE